LTETNTKGRGAGTLSEEGRLGREGEEMNGQDLSVQMIIMAEKKKGGSEGAEKNNVTGCDVWDMTVDL